ncbi:phenylalanine--tRNA ligase subunit beta [Puteibacter caeruleilacunae]|nr:phenylalanine--tRNA ligase subunit beta [Puteibacter caeruleilacunae]
MNISYSWLKDYIDLDLSPEELETVLTQTGLEVGGVEEVETIKGGLKGLVIGEVKTCEPHPNSDHLSKTTVDVGEAELLPIVCGAPNVAAGQKVVVATVGTILYDGDNEFKIKKSKIRGEVSMGMICAEDEIGLGNSHEGIMVLEADAKVGTPASEFFNIESDYVIEIDLTPNRIDGGSHIGVARDLAAYLQQEQESAYKRPSVEEFIVDDNSLEIPVEVENTQACPRYCGVTISGVEIKESPEWLQNRLKLIGLAPINNVVDITNYVLHETGQPLHAFDAAEIDGKKIVVKTMPQGTKFTTLDEAERELHENDLMICNENNGMCIAGVFGGIKSGVKETTTDIFLESAYFNPVYVRKTARRHALNTDASFRFERGVDPNTVMYALKRAALLIKEIAGGKISSEIVDVLGDASINEDFKVSLTYNNVARLIGKDLGAERIKNILSGLEIKIDSQTEEGLELSVPPYRVDVKRECDVIEEILRIYGYNNVEPGQSVNSTIQYSAKPDVQQIRNLISDMLTARGFNEIMNNSLTKSGYYTELKDHSAESTVNIFNPLSQDLNAMRQNLVFGGLESAAYNINRRSNNLRLYEFGNCYFKNDKEDVASPADKYYEEMHLGLWLTGNKELENWTSPEAGSNFFELKSYVVSILQRLGINLDSLVLETKDSDIWSENISYVTRGGKTVVTLGFVSAKALKVAEVSQQVFYADFNWDIVEKEASKAKVSYTELPKYPEVRRDLALLIDKSVSFKQIKDIATKVEKKLLRHVDLFDVYEGKNLPEGKKSYAVSFILRDNEKTLKDKQIDKIMQKMIKTYQNELGAELR